VVYLNLFITDITHKVADHQQIILEFMVQHAYDLELSSENVVKFGCEIVQSDDLLSHNLTYGSVFEQFETRDCQLVAVEIANLSRDARGPAHVHAFRQPMHPCAAARIWNRLPPSLTDPRVMYRLFCRQLKSHLFE